MTELDSPALPAGWALTTLDAVCMPVEKVNPKAIYPENFQYLDVGSIDNSAHKIVASKSLPANKPPSRAKQLLHSRDVIFSTVRVYLENIAMVPDDLDGQIASTAFCVLRSGEGLDSQYLYYYVTAQPFISALVKLQRGNSPPAALDRDVLAQKIPLPPSPEQRRIVSRIEELFSDLDEAEANLKRVQALTKQYRQSLLKAAVTGELTREWREQQDDLEDGEALLQRILKARREAWEKAELEKMAAKKKKPKGDAWKAKYKEPVAPDTTDLPELPEGWTWATIEQLCFVETGATPKKGEAKYYDKGVFPWITSTAVNHEYIHEYSQRITETALKETNLKMFPAGSLIVAMYGEGKTRGKVSELMIEASTNQACAALLSSHLDSNIKSFVKLYLLNNYEALRTKAAGGVQPNLNLKIIKELPIPIPPAAEINLINSSIEQAMSIHNKFTKDISDDKNKILGLRQSILKAAFTGQLVPQDPNDEPASELLKRIAELKAATAPPPKKRRAGRPKKQPPEQVN